MVEIIPKKIPQKPLWLNLLFYFLIALLLVSIGSFFLLDHFLKNARVSLAELEEILILGKNPQEKKLEEDIFDYRKTIDDFSAFFAQRRVCAGFFDFLEKLSHSQIWFSKIILNPVESKVWLEGRTPTFQILGQQLFIFQEAPAIENANLSKISMGRGGEVEFVFDLLLSPEIFQHE